MKIWNFSLLRRGHWKSRPAEQMRAKFELAGFIDEYYTQNVAGRRGSTDIFASGQRGAQSRQFVHAKSTQPELQQPMPSLLFMKPPQRISIPI
jgi:hypothetical protein